MLKAALFFRVIFVMKEANPCPALESLLRNLLNNLFLAIILVLLI